jgi:hypothetical protein
MLYKYRCYFFFLGYHPSLIYSWQIYVVEPVFINKTTVQLVIVTLEERRGRNRHAPTFHSYFVR